MSQERFIEFVAEHVDVGLPVHHHVDDAFGDVDAVRIARCGKGADELEMLLECNGELTVKMSIYLDCQQSAK